MATQLVPYNTAMQLGSGFNSFTQTLCINNAVLRETESAAGIQGTESDEKRVAQSVTYKTCVIEKATDVTDEMNINAAFDIRNDNLQVDGSAKYINTNKIKESDVSIMVSVKVVNQVIYDHGLTKFQPIPNFKDLPAQRLIEIYGDSFISGWQEGGEFLAVISIKAKNRDEAQNIAVDARVAFTRTKDPAPSKGKDTTADSSKGKDKGKEGLSVDVDIGFDKLRSGLTDENEVSVSVTWTGGGQELKPPDRDWDFETMRDVALRFPDRCAKTPMRTNALLTKYTALRSFHTVQPFELPVYDKTGTYTNILQEAYLDYKSILHSIQVLAFDVSEGTKMLIPGVRGLEQIKARGSKSPQEKPAIVEADNPAENAVQPPVPEESNDPTNTKVVQRSPSTLKATGSRQVITAPPLIMTDPFPPTIEGLEEARRICRYMMNRIVQEIDNITIKPEIAGDESRPLPYQSPFLFKLFLPIGTIAEPKPTQAEQAVAAVQLDDPDALASKLLAVGR